MPSPVQKRIDLRAPWVAVNQEVDLVGYIWSHVFIDVYEPTGCRCDEGNMSLGLSFQHASSWTDIHV